LKLHYSGISRYFSQLITSEKSNSIKPNKDIFDFALQAAGATVEESIMIGDAVDIDILGAINAGWDSAYYNPQGVAHNHKPTYEVGDLGELINVF
jgi:putative hydrolase of the HAD superfamily